MLKEVEDVHLRTISAFKRAEKLYKACGTVEDAVAAGALDLLSGGDDSKLMLVQRAQTYFGGRTCTEISFAGYCGVHVLCGTLDRKQQMELAYNALHECLAPPNCTNLHAHWDVNKRAELDTIWQRDGPALDDPNTGLSRSSTLSRVRWATLGYQYNWTERSYSKSNFVPFPARLSAFARELALRCSSGFDMHAEAAIVNFYPEGQVMGGHQDDGEEALESPVVSLSIGSPCVFLLGGRDKDEAPLALLLRSGDVLILGGESRLRYHGVPRVWVQAKGPPAYLHPDSKACAVHTSACPAFLEPESTGDEVECLCGCVSVTEVRRALRYLQSARINMNLRQVFR